MRSDPLSEALEGALGTARDWADATAAHATAVTTKLDRATYGTDPDALAADAARSVALVVRGWAQFADAAVEAAVKIARPPAEVRWAPTDVFTVELTGGRRTLRCVGTAWASPGGDVMGTWRVRFQPPVLEDGDRRFLMWVHANDLVGSAYRGEVESVGPGGVEPVKVIAQIS